jgi:hypothetical protein
MAQIEGALLLFNLNRKYSDVYSFFKAIDKDVEIGDSSCVFYNYHCTLFVLDEAEDVSDFITCAVDANVNCCFYAYGENERAFELLELFLLNTEGDFIFLDNYEVIFERRNGIIYAVDSNDHFQYCSFKNCYNLLKLGHVNGFHEDYGLTIRFHNGINELKRVLLNLVKQAVAEDSNVKLIEYDIIPNEFALTADFFGISVSENYNIKDEYYIFVHYSYSDSLKDCRNLNLSNLFRILFESFKICNADESIYEVLKVKRPIGMFEGEKFLADNYDIDDDNDEISGMFMTAEGLKAADVDSDGEVALTDLARLRQYVSKIITEF